MQPYQAEDTHVVIKSLNMTVNRTILLIVVSIAEPTP